MWDILRALMVALALVTGQPIAFQGRSVTSAAKPVKTDDQQDLGTVKPQAPKVQSNAVGPNGKKGPTQDPATGPTLPPGAKETGGSTAANGVGVATAQTPGYVTNVYTDASLRAVFSEVGAIAGVQIIADSSVQDTPVTIEFKNEPVDAAIRKLARFGGLQVLKKDGVYLVSTGAADAPMFSEFAVTKMFRPANTSVESLLASLPKAWKDLVAGDKATNTMTVMASEAEVDRIIAGLHIMDSPPRQLVVEALIADVTSDKEDDFNFSWNWHNFGMSSDLSLSYSSVANTDLAKLKMLITQQRATVRANPRLHAQEGREAQFSVGQELYYALQSTAVANQFSFNQIQTIKTGTTLKFTAFVDSDGTIVLNLDPEVSDAATFTQQGNPLTSKRTAHTTIRMKDGETYAIGGLVQEFSKQTVAKIPILGDLPLVGWLFNSKSKTRTKSEVIMMITPHLTDHGVGSTGLDSSRKVDTKMVDPYWENEQRSSPPVKAAPVRVLPNVDVLDSSVVGPMGARNLFKYDEATKMSSLAGILPSGMSYPADLAVIPSAKGVDGKLMEMLVLRDAAGFSGEQVSVHPIGLIAGNVSVGGKPVYKTLMIGVQTNSKTYGGLKTVDALTAAQKQDITMFASSYFSTSYSSFEFKGYGNPETASTMLAEGVLRKQKR